MFHRENARKGTLTAGVATATLADHRYTVLYVRRSMLGQATEAYVTDTVPRIWATGSDTAPRVYGPSVAGHQKMPLAG